MPAEPLALFVVAAAAAVHLGLAWARARPPAQPVPDLDGYLARWRELHGGYDPATNVWVRGWLRLAYAVAGPFARRGVHPHALTAATVWLALIALATALAGGRWPLLGVVAVVASGLGDAVDGAVATLTDRASRWGFVLDSVTDRVSDVLYVAVLLALGAPLELAAPTAVGIIGLEYVRARADLAGAGAVGTVTVGERASRVICAGVGLLAAGAVPAYAALMATISLGVLAAATVVGLGQLLVAVRRQLR